MFHFVQRLNFTALCALWCAGLAFGCGSAAKVHAQVAPEQGPAATASVAVGLDFKDFFRMPVGPAGLEFTPKILRLDGQQVRITGHMVQQESVMSAGQFLLTPRPVRMSEHADGEADDLPPATLLVRLPETQSTGFVNHIPGPMEWQGVLTVGRHESSNGRVTWVQLQLPPDAWPSAGQIHRAVESTQR
jgi:hypothetical protein